MALMQPASEPDIARMLAELAVSTRRKDLGDEDAAPIMLDVYVRRLQRYPADIVARVLEQWPDQSEFFPVWKELRDLLELRTSARQALIDGIRGDAPDPQKAWLADIEKSDPARAAILRKAH